MDDLAKFLGNLNGQIHGAELSEIHAWKKWQSALEDMKRAEASNKDAMEFMIAYAWKSGEIVDGKNVEERRRNEVLWREANSDKIDDGLEPVDRQNVLALEAEYYLSKATRKLYERGWDANLTLALSRRQEWDTRPGDGPPPKSLFEGALSKADEALKRGDRAAFDEASRVAFDAMSEPDEPAATRKQASLFNDVPIDGSLFE